MIEIGLFMLFALAVGAVGGVCWLFRSFWD